jgi:hypothetical protein
MPIQQVLPCDGCGLPATPEHIAARIRRLELSTRYRPVHIGLLFVAMAPPLQEDQFFYGPPSAEAAGDFFDSFLSALEIEAAAAPPAAPADVEAAKTAQLVEFQRRGYHLAYLSECPIPEGEAAARETIAREVPTLIRRIRFNYRPKHIALLGAELAPIVDLLRAGQNGLVLTLDQGQPLPVPRTGDQTARKLFQNAIAGVVPKEYLSPGYGRIRDTGLERELEAGGNT